MIEPTHEAEEKVEGRRWRVEQAPLRALPGLPSTLDSRPSLRPRPARRGVTAMLAMMFLMLFSTLALGFYATVTMGVASARNETYSLRARFTTESGLAFLRYHLQKAEIVHDGPDAYMRHLRDELAAALEGTTNLTLAGDATNVILFEEKLEDEDADGLSDGILETVQYIQVPKVGYIPTDDRGSGFRATIRRISTKKTSDQLVRVTVDGRTLISPPGHDPKEYINRYIQLDFLRRSSVLDYGMATRGSFVLGGSANVFGSPTGEIADLLSLSTAVPAVTIGGKSIGGDIYTVSTDPSAVSLAGGTVAGESDPAVIRAEHVHQGVPVPEFPTVDTSGFIPYATNAMTSVQAVAATNLTNVRLLASSVLPPLVPPEIILDGKTIRGVLYIQSPNNVKISGTTNMKGIIVTESAPIGSPATNKLTITGNATMGGVETLDPAVYGNLTKMGGSLLLMPGFYVKLTGASGVVGGTMAGGQFEFTGNTGLNLDGSVIGLDNLPMSVGGSGEITIRPPTFAGMPSGLKFASATGGFKPIFSSFREVKP